MLFTLTTIVFCARKQSPIACLVQAMRQSSFGCADGPSG